MYSKFKIGKAHAFTKHTSFFVDQVFSQRLPVPCITTSHSPCPRACSQILPVLHGPSPPGNHTRPIEGKYRQDPSSSCPLPAGSSVGRHLLPQSVGRVVFILQLAKNKGSGRVGRRGGGWRVVLAACFWGTLALVLLALGLGVGRSRVPMPSIMSQWCKWFWSQGTCCGIGALDSEGKAKGMLFCHGHRGCAGAEP